MGHDCVTHLVTVTPLVVLGADVLVRVLGALLQRGHVRPVLPMSIPQVIGVGPGEREAGTDAASTFVSHWLPRMLGSVAQVVLDLHLGFRLVGNE